MMQRRGKIEDDNVEHDDEQDVDLDTEKMQDEDGVEEED